ncbi:hypothetical protein BASA83_006079 [Batrachochytrium salamandrivorans]|nr:hypothetical protein BASA83_006079 [Batrachochytrium salamandrivorans]
MLGQKHRMYLLLAYAERHSHTSPVGALLWKLHEHRDSLVRTLAFLKALVHSIICSSSGMDHFPGLPRDTNPIRGLMYADDVAVFADSEQSLLAASTAIEQWANQWENAVWCGQCGIISFTGPSSTTT